MYKILLAHGFDIQIRSSRESPKQWSPYLSGYGLEQDLSRRWMPTSHVTEQDPHSDHILQSPLTLFRTLKQIRTMIQVGKLYVRCIV